MTKPADNCEPVDGCDGEPQVVAMAPTPLNETMIALRWRNPNAST